MTDYVHHVEELVVADKFFRILQKISYCYTYIKSSKLVQINNVCVTLYSYESLSTGLATYTNQPYTITNFGVVYLTDDAI